MSKPKNLRPGAYIVRGVLNGKKAAYGKSTMSAMTEYSVFGINKLIDEGLAGQDLLDKVFEKQLAINEIHRRFTTKVSPRVYEALRSSGRHFWQR